MLFSLVRSGFIRKTASHAHFAKLLLIMTRMRSNSVTCHRSSWPSQPIEIKEEVEGRSTLDWNSQVEPVTQVQGDKPLPDPEQQLRVRMVEIDLRERIEKEIIGTYSSLPLTLLH